MGIRPPQRPAFPSHIQYTGDNAFLSPPEVDAVRAHCDAMVTHPGEIGNGGDAAQVKRDDNYRCVETGAVLGLDWLYERIIKRVQWANEDHFRLTLSGIVEPVGYLKYKAASDTQPVAGHYNWHQDFGGGPFSTRKLSLVVQLSRPEEYDGCRLMLFNDGPWEVPYVNAGDAILFPSWTPHCVTDITRGERRALVVWVHGPQLQ